MTHRLPEGIMPCCDVVNRGAAICGDKIYFGTLDAQLVALNKDTGKVVWNKKLDDYQAGFSMTAAPLIVDGKIITGSSGGEFGVVGAVEARDAETGELVWIRPTVEGHMGTLDTAKKSTHDGHEQRYAGRAICGRPAAAPPGWAAPMTRKPTSLFFGTGNPAPWNSHLRPGDNLYPPPRWRSIRTPARSSGTYQTTPHDGWDFDGVNEFISFDLKKDGKVVKAGAKADRNGFFYRHRPDQRQAAERDPVRHQDLLGQGLRPEDRPADTYTKTSRPPATRRQVAATARRASSIFAAPSFLGGKNWMPMAYSPDTGLFYVPANEWGMDIWNEPITYKKGAAYLGAGFTIKPLYDDYIGALRAIDPKTGKIVWEYKNPAPLWGGVLTTGRQPRVHRHAGRLPEGLRRQDRQGALEVQHRLRRRRLRRSPGNRTASSMSPSFPAGVAPSRCGVARSPRRSRTSTRAACCGSSSCRRPETRLFLTEIRS